MAKTKATDQVWGVLVTYAGTRAAKAAGYKPDKPHLLARFGLMGGHVDDPMIRTYRTRYQAAQAASQVRSTFTAARPVRLKVTWETR